MSRIDDALDGQAALDEANNRVVGLEARIQDLMIWNEKRRLERDSLEAQRDSLEREQVEDRAAIRALLDLYASTKSTWILAWDTVRSKHAVAIARATQEE